MKTEKIGRATIHNMDCMDFLKSCEDNQFSLAIVDPPYGIARFGSRVDKSHNRSIDSKINKWDIAPSRDYFLELSRVSDNQIIWGANNFQLPKTEYFCIWDKEQTVDNFASAEYAYVSMGLKKPAKVFRYSIHKTMAERKAMGGKIHPTQKPVALYEWLLKNYAKAGDSILDTHGGSMSSAIACNNMGFDVTVCELDEDYYREACERIKQAYNQTDMFTPPAKQQITKQGELL